MVIEGRTKNTLPLPLPLRLESVEEALEQPITQGDFIDETNSLYPDTAVYYPLYEGERG